MQTSKLSTYGLVMLVMVLWGVNIVFLKVLVEAFPATTMTSFRIFTAGIVVAFVVLLLKRFKRISKQEWRFIILGSLFGVVGHHYFLANGLTLTTASNGVLILGLLPLTTSVLAAIMLKDKLSSLRVVGIVSALVGVLIIIMAGSGAIGGIRVGDLLVLVAMFCQALSFIYIKKGTETMDSREMTAVMLVIGSVLLFLVSLWIEPGGGSEVIQSVTGPLVAVFLASALLSTALGHFLYNEAIHKLGAGQAAIFNNFVPFFGIVASALFLGEVIYWLQIVGFIFIVIGVLFGTGYVEEKHRKRQGNKQKPVVQKIS
ncbi:DMT family transporter [Bacillus alkalicellulosilyticus]|uniref:DMT family transporter n=1 Tax=Alkalihalobacterium alkalicellulosilyticum TaxID=1912214 RepID=UPI0009968EF3|nr:DMT family transporter [Bacillus alkalicellulosilyticus]